MFEMDQFRADFAVVHRTERAHGRHTDAESRANIAEAGKVVRDRMKDAAWMRDTATHYAEMAGAIRRDMERSQQIRIEMHAERTKRIRAEMASAKEST